MERLNVFDPRQFCVIGRSNDGNEIFQYPNKKRFLNAKVIVSTCITAGVLHGLGMPRDHFDYVIVDESGQATEPECLTAISAFVNERTRVILAGDPKQVPLHTFL